MIKRFSGLSALVCWLCLSLSPTVGLALESAVVKYPRLADSTSQALQQGLEEGLKKLSLDRAIAEGRLAVSVIDVSDPLRPRVAEVKANKHYAATFARAYFCEEREKSLEWAQHRLFLSRELLSGVLLSSLLFWIRLGCSRSSKSSI